MRLPRPDVRKWLAWTRCRRSDCRNKPLTPYSMPAHAVPAETICFTVRTSSLGLILIAASSRGIVALLMGDTEEALRSDMRRRFPEAILTEETAGGALEAWAPRALELVESPSRKAAFALDARGTVFQRAVWRALEQTQPGETITYAGLAALVGRPRSARVVSRACAANPIAVAIPCHRVVRSDGKLSGYRWGPERKRILLEREASAHPWSTEN